VGIYLLDSTVLIDYLRGRPAVERVSALREAGDVPATTAVNVDEIVRGLRAGEDASARSLFTGLAVLPLGRRVGWQAGEWRRQFAALGITLYQADCLIAGAASVHKAVLVTGNPKDFPMSGVTVEHWPVGS
jgi:predicted nucleic acid-binding protein